MNEIRDLEDAREAMFLASIKNRLTRDKAVTTIVQEDFTLEEVKAVMIDKSPVSIYVLPFSHTVPCMHITKLIMPSHNGVYMYYESAADKTPRHYTWEAFYKQLCKAGLHTIRF